MRFLELQNNHPNQLPYKQYIDPNIEALSVKYICPPFHELTIKMLLEFPYVLENLKAHY